MPLRIPRLVTVVRATTVTALLLSPFLLISGAQNTGRGATQPRGGGRGPGAAPDAKDPANANADLSPKPPVLPLSPAEEARNLWLPPGCRMGPPGPGGA